MQLPIKSLLMTYGLCIMAFGCSDQTQFASNGGTDPGSTTEGSADAKGKNGDGTVNGTSSDLDPNAEDATGTISDAATTISTQVAQTADDPSSLQVKPIASNGSQSTSQELQSLCQGNRKTLKQSIKFPETSNCRFGTAGNLDRRHKYLQAMEAQATSISLPGKAQLCGVSVTSAMSTIQYDDFMILTLNGYVLLSSNTDILKNLEGSASTAYKWDFSRIRGMGLDFDSPSYCMGSKAGNCTIPVTDTQGQFQFAVDPTSLIHLADQVVENTDLHFALIATGDNDDQDCWHTELNLEFTLQYVEIP
jgi:hypothetical protein